MSCKVLSDYRYLHRKNIIVNVFRIIANPLNTSFELSHQVKKQRTIFNGK